MRKNKILVATALLMMVSLHTVIAQHKTLLISESGLPYTGQTWFAYGAAGICQDDIVASWDEGKRIVTAAYTGEEWLVVMAGNTAYAMQTYTLTQAWPEQWIAEQAQQGYAITAVSNSDSQWLVVLSQGTGITGQQVWQAPWEKLEPWIAEQKPLGYSITSLTCCGSQWRVVMSQNSDYVSQGYFRAETTNDMMRTIQREVWGKGYNVHQVAYGDGCYIVTYGNYAQGDSRYQNLQVNPDDTRGYINQQLQRGLSITYVGGGLVADQRKLKK